jgi:cytochrome c peroxidase
MRVLLACAAMLSIGACSSSNPTPKTADSTASALEVRPIGKIVPIAAPLGLPAVPIPADNPPTEETIALGKALFFSPLLSADGKISCASCHDPNAGFADPRDVSSGVREQKGNRNAPPAQNACYAATQFWDGRAATLEEQALGPIANPIEMGETLENVVKKLQADASMTRMFQAAFGAPPSKAGIAKAIASFERTLVRGNSPFDRFEYGGDKKALSVAAQRGLAIFRDAKKGNCAVCHTIEKDHALFTDNKFHNIGVGVNPEGELIDKGRYEVTKKPEDMGAFRTPTLRNIALTAPYMHDGSLKTLKEVVDLYVGGGTSNPHLDKEIKALSHLSKQDRADLVAFMESLTGEPAK